MTTHGNFLSNVETAIRVLGIDRADGPTLRNLVSVPLFHVTGCNSQLLVRSGSAGRTVVMPQFEVDAFLRAIVEERIDTADHRAGDLLAGAWPSGDFDRRRLGGRAASSYGGAPIAPDLVRRLQERFPHARVGNGFGLTETSSITTFLPHEWTAEHADSVGFAAPVVDLALADVDRRRRRRAAHPRPERRRRATGTSPGGDGRHVRRRLAAQRRPRPHRRTG